jgi:NAD(P)-dependent dehydrogenase (short-subunit alcohol dehydrogenase family)
MPIRTGTSALTCPRVLAPPGRCLFQDAEFTALHEACFSKARFMVRVREKGYAVMTDITGTAILITGANRGIGRALIEEGLSRGAARIYAGTRGPLAHADERVTPLTLDITDPAQVRAAAQAVEHLDVLINNAGMAMADDLADRAVIERLLAVNFFGPYEVTQAFLPHLASSKGTIVNNLSLNSLAPLARIPAYSISKAAAFSMTQSLRVLLAKQGVRVHAVLTGPVDTDMTRGFPIPKASAADVAKGIFDGIENEDDEIFPDPTAAAVAEIWRVGAAKALEREFSIYAP